MNKLVNFRDLGGYETTNGKKIKMKRLLRSAPVDGLCDTDIDFLKAHNIKLVVDFRSDDEIILPHDVNVLGNRYERADIAGDSFKRYGGHKKLIGLDIKGVEHFMVEVYRDSFINNLSSKQGFSKFLKLCASVEDGAVLFHCTFGKDRTGFAAALLLKILGVSDDVLYSDYLKSIEGLVSEIPKKVEQYQRGGYCEEKALILCGLKREYLESAFESIEKYGGFDKYITDELGITPADIAKLKELYLED
jgi:protein-tyrosine phosphatase